MVDYFESFSNWYFRTNPKDLSKIEEAWEIEAVPDRRTKNVDVLFLEESAIDCQLIESMKNPIVVLLKTSENNVSNLSEEIRKQNTGVRVVVSTTDYLPEIFSSLRESTNNEVLTVYASDKRISVYSNQVDSINKRLDGNKQFNVEFVKTEM